MEKNIKFEQEKEEFRNLLERTLKAADEHGISSYLIIENSSRELLISYITRDYLDPRHRYPVWKIIELEQIRRNTIAAHFKKGDRLEK